jgi:ribonuclease HI
MTKKKFYTVWRGRTTGVYDNWDDCKKQVHGFDFPQYKSFPSQAEAMQALKDGASKHIASHTGIHKSKTLGKLKPKGNFLQESIAVDGAWNTATLECEYRGVFIKTGKQIFLRGPFKDGTNNIMEFLAVVHALAYCKQNNLLLPIYSDSMTALAWVRNKKAKTKLDATENNEELFDLIDRAEKWLMENTFKNQLLKWETQQWGENPADFGRK